MTIHTKHAEIVYAPEDLLLNALIALAVLRGYEVRPGMTFRVIWLIEDFAMDVREVTLRRAA